ncbi:MAG: chromosome segregation protein ScpA [Crenarchaeota archaeon]|nr:chromosome segregation protein ScpA [Thermoproteota archaeon]MDA1124875.1 chromosome segregation protein ScpA [Thermoproteota archaeon]
MSQEETKSLISKVPINVLFNPEGIQKRDVWDIDLIQILSMLLKILEKTDKKDLRIAGMAALSSSMIYKLKVESIFALQKAAMEKKPLRQRTDVDIDILEFPYRHESTYPVSLDELLDLLENLIGTIANPRERKGNKLRFEPIEPPDFKKIFNNLENIIGEYQNLVLRKLEANGSLLLEKIVEDLDTTDSIRCFFAVLFLARDEKIDILQEEGEEEIRVTIIK